MLIVTCDKSPLFYRALDASEHSHFGTCHIGTSMIRDRTTALFQVTMYKQFARKVGTSANSALICNYLLRLKNCLARLATASEQTASINNAAGSLCVCMCVCVCLSEPPLFRHGCRTATKFGKHMQIDQGIVRTLKNCPPISRAMGGKNVKSPRNVTNC